MKAIVAVSAAALLGGYALARWLPAQAPEPEPPAPAAGAVHFDDSAPLAERVRELELAVSQERAARQLLEDEVFYLTDVVDELTGGDRSGPARETAVAVSVDQAGSVRRERSAAAVREVRAERLVDAGFTPERAEWILQRESRLQLTMLEARHAATREGDWDGYRALAQAEQQAFRDELGADYERYLDGTGRPTAVVVSAVMDTSPAQRVGLQPGDRILSYGGQRIYSMQDLNRETLAGAAGESVFLQIERDGMPMQIAIPRGPVGITGGGGRRRE